MRERGRDRKTDGQTETKDDSEGDTLTFKTKQETFIQLYLIVFAIREH